jgi:predicted amidohydrolase
MITTRIALAHLPIPATREAAVDSAVAAIAEAGRQGALILCFPECFIPGYRWPGAVVPAPEAGLLEQAIRTVAAAAKAAGVAVILGTERITERGLQVSACVIGADGGMLGWQDKGQLDPDGAPTCPAFGRARQVFTVGALRFGVVICHEGWRYPETVRWAARRGAQVRPPACLHRRARRPPSVLARTAKTQRST